MMVSSIFGIPEIEKIFNYWNERFRSKYAFSERFVNSTMKYTNWIEFKINAMELFLHNPEIVVISFFLLLDSSVTMFNMLITSLRCA